MEIFNLNKGRLQPNGGRLTSPQLIEPGWILRLPADAAGPGVHFGLLPVATARAPHRPSRPGGTGSGIMITGAFLVSAGVALWLIRRRAGPALGRRPAHAGAPEPRAPDRTGCSPATRLTTSDPDPGRQDSLDRAPGWPPPHDDHPSWPDPGDPGPGWRSPAGGSGSAGRESRRVLQHDPATPAERPARRSRQFRAMRLSVLAMTIPILFGLIAATTQLALHGYGHFVFRSAGTGATQQGPSGPAPSQPPAAEHRRPAGARPGRSAGTTS
jgi:hypothetical protein